MGKFAVREVHGSPLVEQLEDRHLLPGEEPVDRIGFPPGRRSARAPIAARACQRHTRRRSSSRVPQIRPIDQPFAMTSASDGQQLGLGGLIDTSRDRAAQPQLVFPAGPPARWPAR